MRRSRDDPTVVLRSLEKLWSLSPTAEDLRECELLGVLYCRIYPEYTVDTVQGKLVRKLLRRYEALFKDSEDYSSLNITKVLATEPLRV